MADWAALSARSEQMARFLFSVCLWLVAQAVGFDSVVWAARFQSRSAACDSWNVSSRELIGWLAVRESEYRVWGKLIWRGAGAARREVEIDLSGEDAELLRQEVEQMLRGVGSSRLRLDRRVGAQGQCEVWRIRA